MNWIEIEATTKRLKDNLSKEERDQLDSFIDQAAEYEKEIPHEWLEGWVAKQRSTFNEAQQELIDHFLTIPEQAIESGLIDENGKMIKKEGNVIEFPKVAADESPIRDGN